MKRVPLMALALVFVAAAGLLLRGAPCPEPPARFLPFQLAAGAHSEEEAREWHRRLLRARNRPEAADHGGDDLLLELALDQPELLSDPDLAATAARMVAAAAERGDEPTPLCLAYRWTPARLQPMAEACREALDGVGGKDSRPLVQQAPEGVVLIATEGELGGRVATYLRNPYDSGALDAVARNLARAGHASTATRLYQELLQLDAGRAARLQSALAELGGVRHPSHELKR